MCVCGGEWMNDEKKIIKHIKIKMCAEKSLSKSQQQQVIFRKKWEKMRRKCCYIKMLWLYKSTGHERRGSVGGWREEEASGAEEKQARRRMNVFFVLFAISLVLYSIFMFRLYRKQTFLLPYYHHLPLPSITFSSSRKSHTIKMIWNISNLLDFFCCFHFLMDIKLLALPIFIAAHRHTLKSFIYRVSRLCLEE